MVIFFITRNVRIILIKEADIIIAYFHAVDIARIIGYLEKNVGAWSKNWNIQFYKYSALQHKYNIMINKRTTNIEANFMTHDGVKKMLFSDRGEEITGSLCVKKWISYLNFSIR